MKSSICRALPDYSSPPTSPFAGRLPHFCRPRASPSGEEAALVLYLDRGMPSASMAAQIGGVRTNIIRTDRFRAFGWNERAPKTCGSRH